MENNAKKRLLIVDDSDINREILKKIFQQNYTILMASNGKEALTIILREKKNIGAVLLDILMPEMDGYQVLTELKEKKLLYHIPVIMITGDTSYDVESKCLEMGATDFINKPFDAKIAYRRVTNAIELYQHKNQLEMLVSIQLKKLKDLNVQLVEKLSAIVEFRDVESGEHIKRVKKLTELLLKRVSRDCPEYGLDDANCEMISGAAALHDIGKIMIPDNILLKPGKLTPDEFEVMKGHTTKGSEIVRSFQFVDNKQYYDCCYDICRHHHERFDGFGYPDHLIGDEISIGAQVVAITDVYDSLVSERVYKAAYPHEKACKMILNGECGVFNPKLLRSFYSLTDEIQNI